jgi:hypothetical protein
MIVVAIIEQLREQTRHQEERDEIRLRHPGDARTLPDDVGSLFGPLALALRGQ